MGAGRAASGIVFVRDPADPAAAVRVSRGRRGCARF
jgi:hypothetical protein